MWILVFMACGLFDSEPTIESKPPEPAPSAAELVPEEVDASTNEYNAKIILDGKELAVKWDDGDTFATQPIGDEKSVRARLHGFNTLESYGPVHKWGNWRFRTLYDVAKQAGQRSASEVWTCKKMDGEGGYNRILVDCPDLRLALLQEGLAHNFVIDTAIESKYLAAQDKAITDKAGMWRKGTPKKIVTSLHSAAEQKEGKKPYNRLASVRTGLAEKMEHEETYEVCQRICQGGSCMVYVPFEQRHGDDIAECLKPAPTKEKEEEKQDADLKTPEAQPEAAEE